MDNDRQTKNAASEGTSESPCWPPTNEDREQIPLLPLFRLCPRCGLPAPVFSSGASETTDALGYRMWRVRIMTRCSACKTTTPYRMGGYVVTNGEYVKAND